MAKRSEQREGWLKDLLITAVEGGINYWAYVDEYDPEAGTCIISPCEDDEEFAPIRMDLDKLASGVSISLQKRGTWGAAGNPRYVDQYFLSERTNGDDGDYDADIADSVMQFACFKEIVYS